MMEYLEKLEAIAKIEYDNLREKETPSQEVRRKIDACSAVTEDLKQSMRVRPSEVGEDFEQSVQRQTPLPPMCRPQTLQAPQSNATLAMKPSQMISTNQREIMQPHRTQAMNMIQLFIRS